MGGQILKTLWPDCAAVWGAPTPARVMVRCPAASCGFAHIGGGVARCAVRSGVQLGRSVSFVFTLLHHDDDADVVSPVPVRYEYASCILRLILRMVRSVLSATFFFFSFCPFFPFAFFGR